MGNSQTYEIEIKSLLGSKDQADALEARMRAYDAGLTKASSHSQLNHYFIGGNIADLAATADGAISTEDRERLQEIASHAKQCSVRTRQADAKVLLVVKATVDDTTSANGTARLEFEAASTVSLDELDQRVLKAGFSYQAKWSRERTDYKLNDVSVSIDKNAGYGYLAEFEKIENDIAKIDGAKEYLRKLMGELGVEELPQDRLERMFAYYNEHWPDYYGTDKVFIID